MLEHDEQESSRAQWEGHAWTLWRSDRDNHKRGAATIKLNKEKAKLDRRRRQLGKKLLRTLLVTVS